MTIRPISETVAQQTRRRTGWTSVAGALMGAQLALNFLRLPYPLKGRDIRWLAAGATCGGAVGATWGYNYNKTSTNVEIAALGIPLSVLLIAWLLRLEKLKYSPLSGIRLIHLLQPFPFLFITIGGAKLGGFEKNKICYAGKNVWSVKLNSERPLHQGERVTVQTGSWQKQDLDSTTYKMVFNGALSTWNVETLSWDKKRSTPIELKRAVSIDQKSGEVMGIGTFNEGRSHELWINPHNRDHCHYLEKDADLSLISPDYLAWTQGNHLNVKSRNVGQEDYGYECGGKPIQVEAGTDNWIAVLLSEGFALANAINGENAYQQLNNSPTCMSTWQGKGYFAGNWITVWNPEDGEFSSIAESSQPIRGLNVNGEGIFALREGALQWFNHDGSLVKKIPFDRQLGSQRVMLDVCDGVVMAFVDKDEALLFDLNA